MSNQESPEFLSEAMPMRKPKLTKQKAKRNKILRKKRKHKPKNPRLRMAVKKAMRRISPTKRKKRARKANKTKKKFYGARLHSGVEINVDRILSEGPSGTILDLISHRENQEMEAKDNSGVAGDLINEVLSGKSVKDVAKKAGDYLVKPVDAWHKLGKNVSNRTGDAASNYFLNRERTKASRDSRSLDMGTVFQNTDAVATGAGFAAMGGVHGALAGAARGIGLARARKKAGIKGPGYVKSALTGAAKIGAASAITGGVVGAIAGHRGYTLESENANAQDLINEVISGKSPKEVVETLGDRLNSMSTGAKIAGGLALAGATYLGGRAAYKAGKVAGSVGKKLAYVKGLGTGTALGSVLTGGSVAVRKGVDAMQREQDIVQHHYSVAHQKMPDYFPNQGGAVGMHNMPSLGMNYSTHPQGQGAMHGGGFMPQQQRMPQRRQQQFAGFLPESVEETNNLTTADILRKLTTARLLSEEIGDGQ